MSLALKGNAASYNTEACCNGSSTVPGTWVNGVDTILRTIFNGIASILKAFFSGIASVLGCPGVTELIGKFLLPL